jgi:hypothetical protein
MSLSSISSIANLQLWLDGRDPTSFVSNQLTSNLFDVLQWNDKSSNAYTFTPLLMECRPILSTNAVRFNMASSFQLMSKQKIPANSTLDLFMIVTPELIRGPRQPFFDSTDFTVSETDTRINTQVYADGGEFFRTVQTPGYTQGFQVYKGDLYAATNVGQVPNFIQRYNKLQRAFTYVREWPMSTGSTRGMAVLDGKLFTVSGSRCEWFNGSTAFVSTNFISSTANCPITYKGEFYLMSDGSIFSGATAAQRPQFYKYNTLTNNMDLITQSQRFIVGNNWAQRFSNAVTFKNDIYFSTTDDTGTNTSPRWNGTFFLSNGIAFTPNPISVYMGHLFVPRNETRIFKWNNNITFNIGRQIAMNQATNGGIVYKGSLIMYKNMAFNTSNLFEVFSGEQGGPFGTSLMLQLTTATVPVNLQPGAIVHDGRLFINWNSGSQVIEYGNGVGMDQPLPSSTPTPLLLTLRKSEYTTQLWFNGQMVQEECVQFTYSNQVPREMHIGGAVGSMSSGFSDSGHDHLSGAIQTVVQYTSNLSQSDRQRVEGILSWQYGIQSNLPAEHPFKNAAP